LLQDATGDRVDQVVLGFAATTITVSANHSSDVAAGTIQRRKSFTSVDVCFAAAGETG
jgi:hypothetical protein